MSGVSMVPERFDGRRLASPGRLSVLASWADLHLIGLVAVALCLTVVLGDRFEILWPIRLILGLAFVLYVPGYCLTAVLLPGREDLTGVERLGMSIGLSVAMVPLLALLLDRLAWGLRQGPILVAECATVALFAALAAWRRSRLASGERYEAGLLWRPRIWWHALQPTERRLYPFLAGALLTTGLGLGWVVSVPEQDQFITEFYVLGRTGRAEDYPRAAALGQELSVTLGIWNHERERRSYRVEGWAVDSSNPEVREPVMQSDPLSLMPGEGREWLASWRMPRLGDDQRVEFLLFVDGGAQPYRRLRLWLDVVPSAADLAARDPLAATPTPLAPPTELVITFSSVDVTPVPVFPPAPATPNPTVTPREENLSQGSEPASEVRVVPEGPDPTPPTPVSVASTYHPQWVRNHRLTQLWSGPDPHPDVTSFGMTSSQFCLFQMIAPHAGPRLYVYNPHTGDYVWIDADAVGPVEPPEPRAAQESVDGNCSPFLPNVE